MKRILNIRLLFLSAIAYGLGIFAGTYFARYSWLPLVWAAEAAVPLLLVIWRTGGKAFLARCCKAGTLALSRFCRRIRVAFLLLLVFFVLGSLAFWGASAAFVRDSLPATQATVSGRIVKFEPKGSNCVYWLEKSEADMLGVTVKLSGRVQIELKGENPSELSGVGNWLTATGVLYGNPVLYGGGVNGYAYRHNLRYTLETNCEEVGFERGRMGYFESLRDRLCVLLFTYMSPEQHGIAYGMLTGDTSLIPDEVLDSFRTAGLAHVFAISGLHVGFIVLILEYLLKKCRCNPGLRFAAISGVLAFYVSFTGLSGSILRASLMFLVLYAAKLLGKRYDPLSALSAAFLLILSVRPLYLFDPGFLMSFSVMLSLISLSGPLNKLLRRRPRSAVGSSIAAEIGILPVSIAYFHTFSLYSALVNILLLPVMSLAFLLIVAFSLLACVLPVAGFALRAPDMLLFGGVFVSGLVARIPYAELALYSLGGLAAVYYLGLFLCSRFCLLRGKARAIAVSGTAAIFIAGLLLQSFVSQPNGYGLAVYGKRNAVLTWDDSTYFVSAAQSGDCGAGAGEYLRKSRVRRLDGVVIVSPDSDYLETIEILSAVADFTEIYLPLSQSPWDAVRCEILENLGYTLRFVADGDKIGAFTAHADGQGLFALSNRGILYCCNLNAARLERVKLADLDNTDIIASDGFLDELYGYYRPQYLLSYRAVAFIEYPNYYSADRFGTVTLEYSRFWQKFIFT